MIKNKIIQRDAVIILDEPEVHLHPEWQLVFAELVVLLHKEFGITVLLNTYSPYFLRSIQVYAAKYDVFENCSYYITELEDKYATVKDVSNDIGKLYEKLGEPLKKLAREEAEVL